ncbi:MAG: hypothetical protein CM1200mP30_19530 [Pseudomonadota bacterium]|nr:MAG: hypothetical protein CM1200mP30_19530 [Pseudomonadota bacterium]
MPSTNLTRRVQCELLLGEQVFESDSRLCQELHLESYHDQIILPCILGLGFVSPNNRGTQMHLKSSKRISSQILSLAR